MILRKSGILTDAGAALFHRRGSAAVAVPADIIMAAGFHIYEIQEKKGIKVLQRREVCVAEYVVVEAFGDKKAGIISLKSELRKIVP